MATDQRNPFDPALDGAPLRLTFDSRSLQPLRGHLQDQTAFLASLAYTDKFDGLVVWAEEGFAPDLPAAEPHLGRGHLDSVRIGLRNESHATWAVPMAGQWERLAADAGLAAPDCDWLVHYGLATTFHAQMGRHLFVTQDQKLLRARSKGPFRSVWRGKGICSLREAFFYAGALMRVYGWYLDDAKPGYTHRTSVYTLRTELAVRGLANRRRLFHWLAGEDQSSPRIRSMGRLEQSLVSRALDLLRARDGVERETLRTSQDNATADELEYHLRAAVLALAAACDSVALLCCLALGVPDSELPEQQVSFQNKDWKSAISNHGGSATRKAASAHAPVLAVVKSFRDPIIHQAGISGTVIHYLDEGFREMAIAALSDEQIRTLEALGTKNGAAKRWGLRRSGTQASLAPRAFATSLAHGGMRLVDDVLGGLASDMELAAEQEQGPALMSDRTLARLRLLNGIDPAPN